MTSSAATQSARPVVWAWALLSLCLGLWALPAIEDLGLYYDEAFLAQQARGFVEPDRAGLHPASVRSLEIAGRPFPTRNAAYLGSLKSQLLIPAFSVAGVSVRVLRIATLSTALLALLLAMLWAQRLFGEAAAVLMGVFVVSDPSFYFFSQFEWGPFTTNFLCRAAGALAVVMAWKTPSARRAVPIAALAGICLGLGVYSRADFALILACAGVAILISRPDLLRQAIQEKRSAVLAGSLALLLASLPMLFSSLELLASTQAIGDRGDFFFRLDVLQNVLDGSQFHRVMRSGGVFERITNEPNLGSFLGVLGLLAAGLLSLDLYRKFRKQGGVARKDPKLFLLLMTGLLMLVMLSLPGAVRAHHHLNVLPLPQLIVACAVVHLWRSQAKPFWQTASRVGAALILGVLVVGNLRVIAETRQDIALSGGQGRFSASLIELATELDAQPHAQVVSLDWGFHEPLLFLTDRAEMIEPIWGIPRRVAAGGVWNFEGDQHTTYLIHGREYDLMGIGPSLLIAARTHPELDPRIRTHRDKRGEIAFYSVVIEKPHTLNFDGRFTLQARQGPGRPSPEPQS